MKFQFITSVAAMLLSAGHGVFAAEESIPQNCERYNTDRSTCTSHFNCLWVEMEYATSGAWMDTNCCERNDLKCILGYNLKDLLPAPTPTPPAPTPRRPSRSRCVKLGEEAADDAQNSMCGLLVQKPWTDNSQLMDCRQIAINTCKNELAGMVQRACRRDTDHSEVRSECKNAVNSLLGSSSSEDVEMESYDEDFRVQKKRSNKKPRRQGGNKKPRQANKKPVRNTRKVTSSAYHGCANGATKKCHSPYPGLTLCECP